MREIKLRLPVENNKIYEGELFWRLRTRGFWYVCALEAWVKLKKGDILLVEEKVYASYGWRVAIFGPETNGVMIVEEGEVVERRAVEDYFGRDVKNVKVIGNVFENPELVKRYKLENVVNEYFK